MTENITKIIRECWFCSVSFSNTVKEEWYARITKLRKMVDQLFCKKFGEYRFGCFFFFFYGFVFLEGCFHYFLWTSTWMRPLIVFFKYLKSWQLSKKERITLLLIWQGKFIVKKKCKSCMYSSSNFSQFLPIWIFFPLVNKTTIYLFISIAVSLKLVVERFWVNCYVLSNIKNSQLHKS